MSDIYDKLRPLLDKYDLYKQLGEEDYGSLYVELEALIADQVREARIDELRRVPRISYSAEFAIHIEAYLDSRLAKLKGDDK